MTELTDPIDALLKKRQLSLSQPQKLAKAIKALSDQYTQKFHLDRIWKSEFNQTAYLTYFFPLNYLRLKKVFEEARSLGLLEDIQHVYDIGSGTGVGHILFQQLFPGLDCEFHCVEKSVDAIEIHKEFIENSNLNAPTSWIKLQDVPSRLPKNSLCLFSYSLNELDELPLFASSAEAMIILEPSTRSEGRALMEQRKVLMQMGYTPWAPCTHKDECPLLKNSQKDWCHNRITADLPEWFHKIEEQLPMKNRTLTYSYLLMHKGAAPDFHQGKARVIGDTLKEKGKVKQAICRGTQREFISWLTKNGEPPFIERGSLIQIPEEVEVKGNELRLLSHSPLG